MCVCTSNYLCFKFHTIINVYLTLHFPARGFMEKKALDSKLLIVDPAGSFLLANPDISKIHISFIFFNSKKRKRQVYFITLPEAKWHSSISWQRFGWYWHWFLPIMVSKTSYNLINVILRTLLCMKKKEKKKWKMKKKKRKKSRIQAIIWYEPLYWQ